jgi:hypothetical protein
LISFGARVLAVEVIKDGGEYAVLFSTADDADDPRSLVCRIAFSNGAKPCGVWRDRGFPLVDAAIEHDSEKGVLKVRAACFRQAESMEYDEPLVTLTGIDFEQKGPPGKLAAKYVQLQQAPDSASPATRLRTRSVEWTAERTDVRRAAAAYPQLEVSSTRCPTLRPFFGSAAPPSPASAWLGQFSLSSVKGVADGRLGRANRADTFGEPAFRFEDVDVVGFRIDLDAGPNTDAGLAELVRPLNFHLTPGSRIVDFRYLAATRTVLVELLRYGRMKLRTQHSRLTERDYPSQHELVVRILVGRVDDDTPQARDPAVYVPAIFVDNPWSKILGRDVQGFDKRMASFCIDRGSELSVLRPDGRVPLQASTGTNAAGLNGNGQGAPPASLREISTIKVVKVIGDKKEATPLLALGYFPSEPAGWDDFKSVDLDLALGRFSVGTRWRQTDFDVPEFRRSFAADAMVNDVRGFRSVQVSPLGKQELDKTWITSTFAIDGDVKVAYPTGGATLTFYENTAAPAQWATFCRLLGPSDIGLRKVNFQTGSWYRLKFSLSMTVDDGLEWND